LTFARPTSSGVCYVKHILVSHQWDVDGVGRGNSYKRYKSCHERVRREVLQGKKQTLTSEHVVL